MRRKQSLLFPLALLCLSLCSQAQNWSGILDPSRAIDWSRAGVAGGIPARSTICSTSACDTLATSVTSSTINAAIASAPAGSVVLLPAGKFTISGGINFAGNGNITLRGAGPTQTTLAFSSGNSCNGLGGDICVIDNTAHFVGSAPVQPGGSNAHNWTGGYAKGSTSLTLDSVSGLSVGTVIILDQANDTADNGGVFVCDASNCRQSGETGSYNGRTIGGINRNQTQIVKVTAISGNTIAISDPLFANNWRSGQGPGIWWPGQIEGVGIENLTVDNTGSGTSIQSGIYFYDCYNCWLKNVRSIRANRNHVYLYQSAHVTVRDSYFFGTQNGAQESYGIEDFISSACLIENNIFEQVASPKVGAGASGSVFSFNFSINNLYKPSAGWNQTTYFAHDAGNEQNLLEGNQLNSIDGDSIHGVGGSPVTYFRNQLTGRGYNGSTLTTSNTHAMNIYAFWRGINVVGNVLGTSGYFTHYEAAPGVSTSSCDTSIYVLGFGTAGCGSGSPGSDTLVRSTLLRWGNYDTVTGTSRFVSAEIPTTSVPFIHGNAVPASQSLPASFYLNAKPSWWGAMPWPAIGPDVTGGSLLAGHAYAIPAQLCYSVGTFTSGILNFNATNCYGSGGGTSQAPAAPTGLTAIVQ